MVDTPPLKKDVPYLKVSNGQVDASPVFERGSDQGFYPLPQNAYMPSMVEVPPVKKSVAYVQIPSGQGVAQGTPGSLQLRSMGQRPLPVRADLTPSAAPVHEPQRPRMRGGQDLPALDTSRLQLEPDKSFSAFQSQTALPPMLDAASKKTVAYLHTSLQSDTELEFGEAASPTLPQGVQRSPNVRPDLIPTPAPLSEIHPPEMGLDASVDPAGLREFGSGGQFSLLDNRSAHPPMVDALADKKSVPHLRTFLQYQ